MRQIWVDGCFGVFGVMCHMVLGMLVHLKSTISRLPGCPFCNLQSTITKGLTMVSTYLASVRAAAAANTLRCQTWDMDGGKKGRRAGLLENIIRISWENTVVSC
jgi:hypothetical protein